MGRVLVTRLLRLLATLFAVTFFTFMLTELLPGDPAVAILGTEGVQNEELLRQVQQDLGLDKPWPVRYVNWLGNAVRGDLGESYINRGVPVAQTIKERAPVTAELALLAILIAVTLAVPLGVIGAYYRSRWQDTATSAGVQVALSIPNFIIGIMLILVFSVTLGWLPASNWNRVSDGLGANLKTAILPATALAMTQMAIFSRLVRADMINTLQENFILAAKAKGLSNKYILFRHALRPSSLSLMTILGINLGALLGGSVVIEFLFAIPGLGRRLIDAINQRDLMVIQGITVFVAVTYVVINTVVDLLYSLVDPRIRRS